MVNADDTRTLIDYSTFALISTESINTTESLIIINSIFYNITMQAQERMISCFNSFTLIGTCVDHCSSDSNSLILVESDPNRYGANKYSLISISSCYADLRIMHIIWGWQTHKNSNYSNTKANTYHVLHTDNMYGWDFKYVSFHKCNASVILFYDDPSNEFTISTPASDTSFMWCTGSSSILRIYRGNGEKFTRLTMYKNQAPNSITGKIFLIDYYIDDLLGSTDSISFDKPFVATNLLPTPFPDLKNIFCLRICQNSQKESFKTHIICLLINLYKK